MRFLRLIKAPLGLLLALSLFTAVGGPWSIVQGIAWVRMAVAYSAQDGVPVALQKTLDGKHPCKLCHEIVKHQKPVKSDPVQVEFQLKLEPFCLMDGEVSIAPRSMATLFLAGILNPITYSSSPPIPPPRESLFLV